MSAELITSDNLSKELLASILEAAMMDVTYDSDGDIAVRDDILCYVFPDRAKGRIRLMSMWGFKPEVSLTRRLEVVNKINEEYVIVKAVVTKHDTVRFEYDILVAGGITKKAFVMALKRFCGIPYTALNEHADGLIQ